VSSQPKQKRRCPSCGSTNPANATSCDVCGFVFDAADAGASRRSKPVRSGSTAQPAQAQPRPSPPPSVTSAPPPVNAQLSAAAQGERPTRQEQPADPQPASVAPTDPQPMAGQAEAQPAADAKSETPSLVAEAVPKPKTDAAAHAPPARPKPTYAAPARPKPKTFTSTRRALAASGSRSRIPGVLSLVLILAAVLGVVALLAAAIVGSGSAGDSSARPTMPTPVIATQVPEALPAVATAASVAEPTATATDLPAPSPAPTDTPPPPTETPIPQPTDAPAAESGAVSYTVKQGDSCWAIATRFGVSVEEVIRQNKLTASCLIRPGQVLTITR
jgi:S-DNA-T family DNA segregation ATPase FtsK/SpoIIIE